VRRDRGLPAAQPALRGTALVRGNRGSILVRLLTAAVLIPIALGLLWVPQLHLGFTALIAVFAFVGAREYYQMGAAKQHNPEAVIGEWGCVAMVLCALAPEPQLVYVMLMYLSVVMAAAWLHILRGHPTMDDLAVTVFGLTWVGLMAAHISMLHNEDRIGPGLVTMALTAVVLSDTGAYFAGKNLGRRKLAPRISPNKTIEGSIGGLVAAMAGMGIIVAIRDYFDTDLLPDWAWYRYVVTGLIIAVAGQVGDLVESLVKRDAGVKDSGAVLPGHGGVLDRCDGMLFAGPVMYYLQFLGQEA